MYRRIIVVTPMVAATLVLAGCVSSAPRSCDPSVFDQPEVVAESSFLAEYAATRRYGAGQPVSIKVVPDGSAVLFLRSDPRSFSQDLYEFDTGTGRERRLLTASQVLQGASEQVSDEEKARRERMRVSARGIVSYRLSKDGSKILIPLSGRLFVIARIDERAKAPAGVIELVSDHGYPIDPKFSPDGKHVSCVRNGDLYVIDLATRDERQLTFGAEGPVTHGLAEFVAQEEMGRYSGYWWSPDSTRIAYQRTDNSQLESLHIMDAMRPERAPQTRRYPRPGKKNADVTLGIISVFGGLTRWVDWDRERYPYLATVKWSDPQGASDPEGESAPQGGLNSAPLTIVVQNRRQTEEAVLRVNADPQHGADIGTTSVLLVEKDEAWINLDQAMPRWLPGGTAFLWTTERNGSWQLELRHADGSLAHPVTTIDFALRGVVDVDAERGVVVLRGGSDPTQSHLFEVPLTGHPAQPRQLTTLPGLHVATFAKNHRVCVHTASLADGRMVRSVLMGDVGNPLAGGTDIGQLRSVAAEPAFVPKLELTTVGTSPRFHAVIIRPRNFDAARRYPVIVSVYGGPHSQTVRAAPRSYLRQQWFADHGFIVVSIDGRGTPSRGRSWERAIKYNLIEQPLADQVAALQALGEKYREMDLTRVGVYGWSFGGYFSAMAVMRRPDVFHVGIAGAPVADWRDYDTHYTERYMGLPSDNEAGYDDASVLTHAKNLTRPLLIIHGTADDNVYFMHSMKMSNALFRAGAEHEFLVLSDFTHMVADPLVTERLYSRMIQYFVQHLYG